MSARLAAFAASTSQDLTTRWPLQDMLGADLLRRAAADRGGPAASRDARTRATGAYGSASTASR